MKNYKQNRQEKVRSRNSLNDHHGTRSHRHGSERNSYTSNSKSRLPQPRFEKVDYYGDRHVENYSQPKKRLPAPKKPPRYFTPRNETATESQNDHQSHLSTFKGKRTNTGRINQQNDKENIHNGRLLLPQPNSKHYNSSGLTKQTDQRIPVPVPRRKKTGDESDNIHHKNGIYESHSGRKYLEDGHKPRAQSWHPGSDGGALRQPQMPHAATHAISREYGYTKNKRNDELPRPGNPHLQEKGSERYSSFVEFTPPEARCNKKYSADDHYLNNDVVRSNQYPLRLPVPKPRPKSEPPVVPYDISKENTLGNKDYEKVIDALSKMRRSNNSTPEYAVVKKWRKFKPPNEEESDHEHGQINTPNPRSNTSKVSKYDTPDDIKSLKHTFFQPDFGSRNTVDDYENNIKSRPSHDRFSTDFSKSKYKGESKLSEEASRELKNLKFKKPEMIDSDSDYAYMSPYGDDHQNHHHSSATPHRSTENHDPYNLHTVGKGRNRSRNLSDNDSRNGDDYDDDYSDEKNALLKRKHQSYEYHVPKPRLNLPKHNIETLSHQNGFHNDENESETSPGYQSLNNFRKTIPSVASKPQSRNSIADSYDHIESINEKGKERKSSTHSNNDNPVEHSKEKVHEEPMRAQTNVEKQEHSNEPFSSGVRALSHDDIQIHTTPQTHANETEKPSSKQDEPNTKPTSIALPMTATATAAASSWHNNDESKGKAAKDEDDDSDEKDDEAIFETLMLDGYDPGTIEQPLLTSTQQEQPLDYSDGNTNKNHDINKNGKLKEHSNKDDAKEKGGCMQGLYNYWKDFEPSDECPWGRLLGFRKETYEELKKRITCRTVFVTPTFSDAILDNPFTELSFDKFDSIDKSRPSFVSRSFERMDKNPSDLCLAEKNVNDIQNITDSKSGLNVRLFCEGCGKFESKECNGPPPEVPPRPDTKDVKQKSKKEKRKSSKKAPKAKREKSK